MVNGIYCYKDSLNDGEIVYVGIDSHIDENKRHRQHMYPSHYNFQVINRVLQNNPDRYSYHVLKRGDFGRNLLSALEIIYIRRYNPKFNYTIGGDGVRNDRSGANNPFFGKKHTKESRQKMSQSRKGLSRSEETKKKISNSLKGRVFSEETKLKLSLSQKGRPLSKEHRENMIKSKNSTGIFRVSKRKQKDCLQGFRWVYQYPDENKKIHSISSVDLDKLKEKVLARGLEWREL